MIVGLDALQTNIDVNYGYQYVAIPFLRDELLQNLMMETIDEMEVLWQVLYAKDCGRADR